MAIPPTFDVERAVAAAPRVLPPREKRERWFELFLVLAISFSGALYSALYLYEHGPSAATMLSGSRWIPAIGHEVIVLLLLWYVLRRSGRTLRNIGLRWSLKDAAWGLLVAVVAYMMYAGAAVMIGVVHRYLYGTLPVAHTPNQFFGHVTFPTVAYIVLGPLCEELVVRAYLMTEIRELTGSAALAVIVSVLFQGSYHLYYGWWLAISISFQFLVFAVYFALWRKALPVIVAHELLDLVALTRL